MTFLWMQARLPQANIAWVTHVIIANNADHSTTIALSLHCITSSLYMHLSPIFNPWCMHGGYGSQLVCVFVYLSFTNTSCHIPLLSPVGCQCHQVFMAFSVVIFCGFFCWKCFVLQFWHYLLTTAAFHTPWPQDGQRWFFQVCTFSNSLYKTTKTSLALFTVKYTVSFFWAS